MTTIIVSVVCLVLLFVAYIVSDKMASEARKEYEEEFINWIAAMSMSLALIQRQLESGPAKSEHTEDGAGESKKDANDVYIAGIQNILDYGVDTARKRRGDIE